MTDEQCVDEINKICNSRQHSILLMLANKHLRKGTSQEPEDLVQQALLLTWKKRETVECVSAYAAAIIPRLASHEFTEGNGRLRFLSYGVGIYGHEAKSATSDNYLAACFCQARHDSIDDRNRAQEGEMMKGIKESSKHLPKHRKVVLKSWIKNGGVAKNHAEACQMSRIRTFLRTNLHVADEWRSFACPQCGAVSHSRKYRKSEPLRCTKCKASFKAAGHEVRRAA